MAKMVIFWPKNSQIPMKLNPNQFQRINGQLKAVESAKAPDVEAAQSARDTLHRMAVAMVNKSGSIKTGYVKLVNADGGALRVGTRWSGSADGSTRDALSYVRSLIDHGYGANPKAQAAIEAYIKGQGDRLGTHSFVKLVRELENASGAERPQGDRISLARVKADARLQTQGFADALPAQEPPRPEASLQVDEAAAQARLLAQVELLDQPGVEVVPPAVKVQEADVVQSLDSLCATTQSELDAGIAMVNQGTPSQAQIEHLNSCLKNLKKEQTAIETLLAGRDDLVASASVQTGRAALAAQLSILSEIQQLALSLNALDKALLKGQAILSAPPFPTQSDKLELQQYLKNFNAANRAIGEDKLDSKSENIKQALQYRENKVQQLNAVVSSIKAIVPLGRGAKFAVSFDGPPIPPKVFTLLDSGPYQELGRTIQNELAAQGIKPMPGMSSIVINSAPVYCHFDGTGKPRAILPKGMPASTTPITVKSLHAQIVHIETLSKFEVDADWYHGNLVARNAEPSEVRAAQAWMTSADGPFGEGSSKLDQERVLAPLIDGGRSLVLDNFKSSSGASWKPTLRLLRDVTIEELLEALPLDHDNFDDYLAVTLVPASSGEFKGRTTQLKSGALDSQVAAAIWDHVGRDDKALKVSLAPLGSHQIKAFQFKVGDDPWVARVTLKDGVSVEDLTGANLASNLNFVLKPLDPGEALPDGPSEVGAFDVNLLGLQELSRTQYDQILAKGAGLKGLDVEKRINRQDARSPLIKEARRQIKAFASRSEGGLAALLAPLGAGERLALQFKIHGDPWVASLALRPGQTMAEFSDILFDIKVAIVVSPLQEKVPEGPVAPQVLAAAAPTGPFTKNTAFMVTDETGAYDYVKTTVDSAYVKKYAKTHSDYEQAFFENLLAHDHEGNGGSPGIVNRMLIGVPNAARNKAISPAGPTAMLKQIPNLDQRQSELRRAVLQGVKDLYFVTQGGFYSPECKADHFLVDPHTLDIKMIDFNHSSELGSWNKATHEQKIRNFDDAVSGLMNIVSDAIDKQPQFLAELKQAVSEYAAQLKTS